mgnify:CR=1 FL=1
MMMGDVGDSQGASEGFSQANMSSLVPPRHEDVGAEHEFLGRCSMIYGDR